MHVKSYLAMFFIFSAILVMALTLNRSFNHCVTDFESCVAAGNPVMESFPRRCRHGDVSYVEDDQRPIGGERDEKGCLGSAGYSFSDEVGACVRNWELDAGKRRAARIVVDQVGFEYATTVVDVLPGNCFGCYIVRLEKGMGRDEVVVSLDDWVIVP